MSNLEVKSGPEIIELIKSRAETDLPVAAGKFLHAAAGHGEVIKNPKASEARIAQSQANLTVEQRRYEGLFNTVRFFQLLDDESHFGSAEPICQPQG